MDIPWPLDKIQTRYESACSSINPTVFNLKFPLHGNFPLKKRRCRSSFSQFRCSSLGQELKPRPVFKPLKKGEEISTKDTETQLEKTRSEDSKSSARTCALIEKLVWCKRHSEALEMFEILERENEVYVGGDTYDALISACIGLKSIRGVKRVFNHMLDSGFDMDLYMMNRVLSMHVECSMMIDARQLFDKMPERNWRSWRTIIGGLVDSGDYIEAFRLFLLKWEDNSDITSRTLTTMIRASNGLERISVGQQLHCYALKMGMDDDIFVSCTLIDMYSKCGNIDNARSVFDLMPEKTTVGWNSIIAGYAFQGHSEEALSMYYEMQESGVKMDHFTCSTMVRICTRLGSLHHAKQAHAGLVRNGFGSDIVANTALVDFYSKWGRIEDARNVFEGMPRKNVVSWNALISGYGNHGRGVEAVELFERMVRETMAPDHVTILAVLYACSYSGLSDCGWEIFESMRRDYKVKPRAMHYACMIELLGREGFLDEALALINDAPFSPTRNMWAALLTACRFHKNVVLGNYAAEKLHNMLPQKLSNYNVLLNIYNTAGKSKEAGTVLESLRRRGMMNLPACTWIEIKKKQHMFLTGDISHPETKAIYDNLYRVMLRIAKIGYVVVQSKDVLPDVDEWEESMVPQHSEKLAVSFGMISTPGNSALQLVQGHRICNDCHTAIKLISKVCRRVIVFRDASRFHRFKDGSCSCGDYW